MGFRPGIELRDTQPIVGEPPQRMPQPTLALTKNSNQPLTSRQLMAMTLLARAIVVASLVCLGSTQLILPIQGHGRHHLYQPEAPYASFEQSIAAQKPLMAAQDHEDDYLDKRQYKAGQFTLRPQTDAVCDTGGSAQWSGTVDVSNEHRLFFWAFESRGNPSSDPVIVWLNGGPGSSSFMGGFGEMGGCMLREDSNGTDYNPFGWNRNATVVILDQPAGVGFSTIAEGGAVPARDEDGSEDFQAFLNILFADVFPEKQHLPLIITAESYGGHFAPTYVKHILDSRSYASPAAFWGNLSGVVLIDAVIDFAYTIMGGYDLLCESDNGEGILNDTGCTYMKEKVPRCEAMLGTCTATQNLDDCYGMVQECLTMNYPFDELAAKNKSNPYNSKLRSSVLFFLSSWQDYIANWTNLLLLSVSPQGMPASSLLHRVRRPDRHLLQQARRQESPRLLARVYVSAAKHGPEHGLLGHAVRDPSHPARGRRYA